ncbi:hypothetical protein C2E31_17590 [Rhodopirellula baltica]|nr:hypothetical protein C2E31_17590 [Rhodopirellula baltica]
MNRFEQTSGLYFARSSVWELSAAFTYPASRLRAMYADIGKGRPVYLDRIAWTSENVCRHHALQQW